MEKKKRHSRSQVMRIVKINAISTFYAQCKKLGIKLDKHNGTISAAGLKKLKKYKITKNRGGRPRKEL